MINNSVLFLLKKIESLNNITDRIFIDILKNYELTNEKYKNLLGQNSSSRTNLNDVVSFFSGRKRNYFTISSKEDFNNLILKKRYNKLGRNHYISSSK